MLSDQWRSSSSFVSATVLTAFIGTFGCSATTFTCEAVEAPLSVTKAGDIQTTSRTSSAIESGVTTVHFERPAMNKTIAELIASMRKLTAYTPPQIAG